MEDILDGISIVVNAVQALKAPAPIVFTLVGIVIFVSPEHLKNAFCPIELTLEGIVMLVNPLHIPKELSPIDVTPGGIVTRPMGELCVLVIVMSCACEIQIAWNPDCI